MMLDWLSTINTSTNKIRDETHFYIFIKVRLYNKPKMTVLKTLVTALFRNALSDKKVSVTPSEVTMNNVTSWKSKRTKNVRNMQQLKIIGMNVIISIYYVSTW
jgi:hypothetical protein